ncbi:DnaA/Hda family protein [Niveibacterium sp. 24ML]|uniref:DnaA/Hda family protein n=1 Tax=Niveibacterium sp. 24ML TaxID=2985512 RepID=UPI00226F6843|nr:DnaA/Hda family protein [Niveibacterium sp. 24ML]MCX9157906.1 DnaA/Hda family protein [Niveibacterium sp. 24ML]
MSKKLKLSAFVTAARLARALKGSKSSSRATNQNDETKPKLELVRALERRWEVRPKFLRDATNEVGVMAAFGVCLRAEHYDHQTVAYIYGKPGTGKTTLLRATAELLHEIDPDFCVPVLACEDFYGDVVRCYQQKSFDKFKNQYRKPDWLLLDDVQHLANKHRTQEELLHLLNARENAGKVTIVTANAPPCKLEGIDDALISRFQGGPVVEIRAPRPAGPEDLDERWGEGREAEKLSPDDWCAILDVVGHDLRKVRGVLSSLWVERAVSGSETPLDQILLRFSHGKHANT